MTNELATLKASLASITEALEQAKQELAEALKSEGQKDEWIDMLSESLRSVIVAACGDDEWEGSVAEGIDRLNATFAAVNAELASEQARAEQAEAALTAQNELWRELREADEVHRDWCNAKKPGGPEYMAVLRRQQRAMHAMSDFAASLSLQPHQAQEPKESA